MEKAGPPTQNRKVHNKLFVCLEVQLSEYAYYLSFYLLIKLKHLETLKYMCIFLNIGLNYQSQTWLYNKKGKS